MNLAEFANALTFTDVPDRDANADSALSIVLPSGTEFVEANLRRFFPRVQRMSTLAIGAIINYGVHLMPADQMFVNVGVWRGFTFFSGLVGNEDKRCVGIDNYSQFDEPQQAYADTRAMFNELSSLKHMFFVGDYKTYFTLHRGTIGFYIYDALHDYQAQYEGLEVAEPFWADNAVILVDDTDWDEPRQATLDFLANRGNYNLLFDRRNDNRFWNGIMVFQKAA